MAAEVWRHLLGKNSLTDALRTAMTSPHALALLAEFVPAEEFQAALQQRPFLVEALDAQTFKTLCADAPARRGAPAGVRRERRELELGFAAACSKISPKAFGCFRSGKRSRSRSRNRVATRSKPGF